MESKQKVHTLLNNKYQLIRTLGVGVYTKIKLGKDIETGKQYSIKLCNNNQEDVRTSILREFE